MGQNECGTPADEIFPDAKLHPPVLRCEGTVEWFTFEADKGDQLWIFVLSEDTYAKPCIYAPSFDFENVTGFADCGTFFFEDQRRLHHEVQEAGTWSLQIRGSHDYQLSITLNEQEASGRLLVPHEPGVAVVPGVNERLGPSPVDGIDGEWVRLDQEATGNERVFAVNRGTPDELPVGFSTTSEVRFYDDDLNRLESPCEKISEYSTCFPPDGAAWVFYSQQPSVLSKWFLRYHY